MQTGFGGHWHFLCQLRGLELKEDSHKFVQKTGGFQQTSDIKFLCVLLPVVLQLASRNLFPHPIACSKLHCPISQEPINYDFGVFFLVLAACVGAKRKFDSFSFFYPTAAFSSALIMTCRNISPSISPWIGHTNLRGSFPTWWDAHEKTRYLMLLEQSVSVDWGSPRCLKIHYKLWIFMWKQLDGCSGKIKIWHLGWLRSPSNRLLVAWAAVELVSHRFQPSEFLQSFLDLLVCTVENSIPTQILDTPWLGFNTSFCMSDLTDGFQRWTGSFYCPNKFLEDWHELCKTVR